MIERNIETNVLYFNCHVMRLARLWMLPFEDNASEYNKRKLAKFYQAAPNFKSARPAPEQDKLLSSVRFYNLPTFIVRTPIFGHFLSLHIFWTSIVLTHFLRFKLSDHV